MTATTRRVGAAPRCSLGSALDGASERGAQAEKNTVAAISARPRIPFRCNLATEGCGGGQAERILVAHVRSAILPGHVHWDHLLDHRHAVQRDGRIEPAGLCPLVLVGPHRFDEPAPTPD